MDYIAAAIFLALGLPLIIFSKPLARSARNNSWFKGTSERDYRTEYLLAGVAIIVVGLLGSCHII